MPLIAAPCAEDGINVVRQVSLHTADPALGHAVLPGRRNVIHSGWQPMAFTVERTSTLNFEFESKSKKLRFLAFFACLPQLTQPRMHAD